MKLRKNTIALAAAACLLLGVNASDAAVTLTFAQVGQNVTATWSGSILTFTNGGGLFGAGQFPNPGTATVGSQAISGSSAGGESVRTFGSGGTSTPTILLPASGTYVGSTFGFSNTTLYYPDSAAGTVFSPSGTMTFANTTLAAIGAASFNNTLAFTGAGNTGGDREIRLTTIPEPSSILLLGLGAAGFVTRRQRKHTI